MKWYKKIESLKHYKGENIDDMMEQMEYAKKDEVGLIHEKNGSGMMVRDDGSVQCFSDYGLGFEIDKKRKTISFYASEIKLFCEEMKWIDSEKEIDLQDEEWIEIQKIGRGEKT